MDVPKDTVFVLYSGILMNEQESITHDVMMNEKRISRGWTFDQPDYTNLWMYK